MSGASVATKAGPAYEATHGADVITTASVHDFRNMARGEATLKGETTSLTAGYAYSTEHDYRSNSFHVNSRTDVLQHNTQFELSYARNFDSVCDRVQPASEASPTRWLALEDSTGCFTSEPDAHDGVDRHRHLRGELGPVVDAGARDPAHLHGAAPRGLPVRSVPEHRAWRRTQGAGARPHEPRPGSPHGARCLVPAPDPRGAALLPPGLLRHVGRQERDGRGRVREVPRRVGARDGAGSLLRPERCSLLERRLHGRRAAARAEGPVLDGRPRALAVLELARRGPRSSGPSPPRRGACSA